MRLVQEDIQSTEEFLNVFKNYVDQERHLDFSQENLVNTSIVNTSEFYQQQPYPAQAKIYRSFPMVNR